jgi:hypothetical protein
VTLHRNKKGIEVDLFRTRTRDLALAVGSEKLWKVFCAHVHIGEPSPRLAALPH